MRKHGKIQQWCFFQSRFSSGEAFLADSREGLSLRLRRHWKVRMKVTTVGGKTYEGEFYSLDPVSKSLTLKGNGDNYIIINAAHIVSYTGEIGQAADVSKFGVR